MPDEHVTDEGDPKKYWTQIPNIVFELGLKPFELVLYAHLKRAAGANANGKCTKSTPTLVRETGMGAGTVSRAKLSLQTKRATLNNKPLIRTKETRNPRGGKKRHEIVVVDIWKENMARFASSSVEIDSPIEQVPQKTEQVPEPSSTLEIKKNLLEEEPSEEKLNTPRGRAEGQVKPRAPKQTDPFAEDRADLLTLLIHTNGPLRTTGPQTKAINWLLETGYSADECRRCFLYVTSQPWRSNAVTWKTISDEIGAWKTKGEPAIFTNGHNGNGKINHSRNASVGAAPPEGIDSSIWDRSKRT